jgi:hypothetical protein
MPAKKSSLPPPPDLRSPSSGRVRVAPAPSEVKGLWFVAARRWVVQDLGEEALRAVLAELHGPAREALEDPLPSAWYPEEALQRGLDAARRVLADDDADQMLDLLERVTMIGINAFWRTALRVTSTEFALRAVPVSWKHIRRGAGEMSVELEGGIGRIHYRDFPYFDDPNYRLLVLGTLRPLLRMSTGAEVPVNIATYTHDSLTVHAKYR